MKNTFGAPIISQANPTAKAPTKLAIPVTKLNMPKALARNSGGAVSAIKLDKTLADKAMCKPKNTKLTHNIVMELL